MKNIIYLFLFTCIVLTGCYYDNEQELYPNNSTTSTTSTTVVTYSGDIQPLMTNKCASPGCHVAGAQSPNLSTYNGVSTNKDRVRIRAVVQKTMPSAGPLSNSDIAKLDSWIQAGAPNN